VLLVTQPSRAPQSPRRCLIRGSPADVGLALQSATVTTKFA
jgi:hypothetical protein